MKKRKAHRQRLTHTLQAELDNHTNRDLQTPSKIQSHTKTHARRQADRQAGRQTERARDTNSGHHHTQAHR